MLNELCLELKNWFDREQPKLFGNFTISNNQLDKKVTDILQQNQYFRIIGSVFNDGVYCFNSELELTDESFYGAIWLMAVPKEIIELSEEIDKWNSKYSDTAESPYSSESFGGYSYSKSQAYASTGGSTQPSWQSAFAKRLNKWRKI